mmetsp:Transcript_77425/g.185562  ORF Transcript_77425/g.185562 Transcript_77425/m.185562 type:complete len:346 (-) Transcript_77425:422-1459(-)
MKQVEGLVAGVHADIGFPSPRRLVAHDVAPGQPAQIAELRPVLLVLNLQKRILCFPVIPRGSTGQAIVPIEVIIVAEIGLDGLQINQHILELPQKEEAGGHALSTWDGVALGGGGAHQLKELLCQLEVLARVGGLTQGSKDHALEDVLPGHGGLQVLDEVVRLHCLTQAQVVNHQVQASLWDDVQQRRQDLNGVLPISENHQVVLQQVVLLENVPTAGRLLQNFKLRLRCLAVVELVVTASLKVHRNSRMRVGGQIALQDFQCHVIVIQLVIAEGDVNVQGQVIAIFHQHALVNIRGLLEVTPEVLDGSQTQLVFFGVRQRLVVNHHGALIVALVGALKEHSRLQ